MAGWNGALVTMPGTITGQSRKKEAGVPAEFAAKDTGRADLFRTSPPPCGASDEPVPIHQLLACLDDMTIGSAVLRHAAALARGFDAPAPGEALSPEYPIIAEGNNTEELPAVSALFHQVAREIGAPVLGE